MPSKLSKTSKASSKPVWEAPYLCGQSLQIFWSAKLPPRCCSNRAGWFRDFSASSKESTRLLKNSSASCCSRKFTGSPHNLLKKEEVISGCAWRCWQVSVSPHEETLKKQTGGKIKETQTDNNKITCNNQSKKKFFFFFFALHQNKHLQQLEFKNKWNKSAPPPPPPKQMNKTIIH